MGDNGQSATPRHRADEISSLQRTEGARLWRRTLRTGDSTPAPEDWNAVFLISWIGRAACLVLAVAFAWLRGGVDFWSQVWMGGLLLVAMTMWLIESLIDRRRTDRAQPWIVLPVFVGVLLSVVQLIPLSDAIAGWVAPRQQEIMESFASPAGIPRSPPTPPTRISLDPTTGRAQLAILCFGLGCVIVGAHFFKSARHADYFLATLAVNGALLATVGILQRIPLAGRTLIPNGLVSGVYPFAAFVNRNNAASYLLMSLAAAVGLAFINMSRELPGRRPKLLVSREVPVWRQIRQRLAVFVAELTPWRIACLLLVIMNAVGVIATLSRGGVLALLVGAILTTMMFGVSRDSENSAGWAALTIAGVIGLALWLGFGATLASRFGELNDPHSLGSLDRIRHWSDTFPAAFDFGWLGSGLGSYHAVHRLYRTDCEERLFEHADNQYLETLIESGWIGLVLLLSTIGLLIWSVLLISRRGNSPRTLGLGAAGAFLIVSLAVASTTDFGVKIPANALALALFVGVVSQHTHALAGRLTKRTLLRKSLPAPISVAIFAAVFLGVCYSTWHLNALAKMERLEAVSSLREDYLSFDEEQTERQLRELEPLVRATPTFWGLRRMGELHLHRYRLAVFGELVARLPASPASLWQSTSLGRLHEQANRLRRMGDQRMIEDLVASPEAKQDIVPAWNWLIASRNLLPLQPDVQLTLARIQSVFGDPATSLVSLDRARRSAPTNADFAFAIGLTHLHAGRTTEASEQWRRCVTLQPKYFTQVMDRIHATIDDRWEIPPEQVFESLIPDDPRLLVSFCNQHLQSEKYASLRQRSFERADRIIESSNQTNTDPAVVALAIQIKMGLGQKQAVLDKLKWLIQLDPSNMREIDLRFELAKLMLDMGLIEEANEEIKWLRKNDSAHPKRYSGLSEKLRQHLDQPRAE